MKKMIMTIVSAIMAVNMIGNMNTVNVHAEETEVRNMAAVVKDAKVLKDHCSSSWTIDIDGTNYRYVLTHDENGKIVFSICDSTDGLQALVDAIAMATK